MRQSGILKYLVDKSYLIDVDPDDSGIPKRYPCLERGRYVIGEVNGRFFRANDLEEMRAIVRHARPTEVGWHASFNLGEIPKQAIAAV